MAVSYERNCQAIHIPLRGRIISRYRFSDAVVIRFRSWLIFLTTATDFRIVSRVLRPFVFKYLHISLLPWLCVLLLNGRWFATSQILPDDNRSNKNYNESLHTEIKCKLISANICVKLQALKNFTHILTLCKGLDSVSHDVTSWFSYQRQFHLFSLGNAN